MLRLCQREIARFVHAQMQVHYREEAVDDEVVVSQGFTELKPSAYTAAHDPPLDFRLSPADKSNMANYSFGGFRRCLYPVQKFHSDAERMRAVVLDHDAIKGFRPAKGQFQLFYRWNGNLVECQPDFVTEAENSVSMLEPKAPNQINAPLVLAKQEAAQQWCARATLRTARYAGKPWKCALTPHDVIAENMTLTGLIRRAGR